MKRVKKALIVTGSLLIGAIIWMAFVRKPLPPIPEVNKAISQKVDMNFSIATMELSGLELELNNKPEGKAMYVAFGMGNAFATGRAGLVLKHIGQQPSMKGKMKPDEYLADDKRKNNKGKGRDFSDFMEDNKGRKVSKYSFSHTLVEGKDGNNYMQMTYNGTDMNMIEQLELPRPFTIPAHVSKQFVEKGNIQFNKGTYALDKKTGSFMIPVTIR